MDCHSNTPRVLYKQVGPQKAFPSVRICSLLRWSWTAALSPSRWLPQTLACAAGVVPHAGAERVAHSLAALDLQSYHPTNGWSIFSMWWSSHGKLVPFAAMETVCHPTIWTWKNARFMTLSLRTTRCSPRTPMHMKHLWHQKVTNFHLLPLCHGLP